MDDQSPLPVPNGPPHDPGSQQDIDLSTGLGSLTSMPRGRGGRVSPALGSSTSLIRSIRGPLGGPPGSPAWLFFGVDGRIARKTYWLGTLVACLASLVGSVCVGIVADSAGTPAVTALLFAVLVVATGWASIGLNCKRWHDRDKSGWWIFIAAIPLVGPIWSLVETGFLRGTPGPNRFGAEPIDVFAP
jgi:uncharacterized membrane protein YhaH (DUF805 family)